MTKKKLQINNLNKTEGFEIVSAIPKYAGNAVDNIGDVNGDKISDFAISDVSANGGGVVYVVYGKDTFGAQLNVSNLEGTNGFKVYGEKGDNLGVSVSGADIDNDGLSDIIIGTEKHTKDVYVLFGNPNFASDIYIKDFDSSMGFKILGSLTLESSEGDFNGDGISDIVAGNYVIFGHSRPFPAVLNETTLDGTNGYSIKCLYRCTYAKNAGDFNGDGIDDIVIGEDSSSLSQGNAFVIFGHKGNFDASMSLSSLDGSNGVTYVGETIGESAGCEVNSAGDFNGDGLSDIVISTCPLSTKPDNYMVFGSKSTSPASVNLGDTGSYEGFSFYGHINQQNYVALDFNNDKISDLLTHGYNPNSDEESDKVNWIIFGRPGPYKSYYNLSELESLELYSKQGFPNIGNAGDINGDGYEDAILGKNTIFSANEEGNPIGCVVFGRSSESKITTTASSPATPSHGSSDSLELSGGAIAGIVVGLLVVAGSAAFAYNKYFSSEHDKQDLGTELLGVGDLEDIEYATQ